MGHKIETDHKEVFKIENQEFNFDAVLLAFLKRSAEEGFDLEQVTVNVFDDVFSDGGDYEPFDGSLSTFSVMFLDSVNLKRQIGSAILDVIMPATTRGVDIYDLISDLEDMIARKSATPGKLRPARQTKRTRTFSMANASGVPRDNRHVHVVSKKFSPHAA